MRFFIAVTDYEWFRLHTSKSSIDEVNFWRPSAEAPFKALKIGEMLLFKLHSPRNFIVGGGSLLGLSICRSHLRGKLFGEGNGVRSLSEMRSRIAQYRRVPIAPTENPSIGCILLAEPFFLAEDEWIPVPSDFSPNIVQGKGYDDNDGFTGESVWTAIRERLAIRTEASTDPGPATIVAVEGARYGQPTVIRPRLGQGIFQSDCHRRVPTQVYCHR